MAGASWWGFYQRPPPRALRGWSRLGWQSSSVFIMLPLLGAQLGIDLSVVSHALAILTGAIIEAILIVTGNI